MYVFWSIIIYFVYMHVCILGYNYIFCVYACVYVFWSIIIYFVCMYVCIILYLGRELHSDKINQFMITYSVTKSARLCVN